MRRLLALPALLFALALPAEAQNASRPYVRAREFAFRFANVIGFDGRYYTIGREADPVARRLRLEGGSRWAYADNRRLRLSRAPKVDSRGLLIPPAALTLLGCQVGPVGESVRVTCRGDGGAGVVSYSLATYPYR